MGDEIQYWWVRIYDGAEPAHVEFHDGAVVILLPGVEEPYRCPADQAQNILLERIPRARHDPGACYEAARSHRWEIQARHSVRSDLSSFTLRNRAVVSPTFTVGKTRNED